MLNLEEKKVICVNESFVPVNSIFTSLEGEGMQVGTPTVFVRVQGCNIGCSWCDTPEAQARASSEDFMAPYKVIGCIAKQIDEHNIYRVSFTGGNPVEYLPGIHEIIVGLRKLYSGRRKLSFNLEHPGFGLTPSEYRYVSVLSEFDTISFDLKAPSFGGCDWDGTPYRMIDSLTKTLSWVRDEPCGVKVSIKTVIANASDLQETLSCWFDALSIFAETSGADENCPIDPSRLSIYLSPMHNASTGAFNMLPEIIEALESPLFFGGVHPKLSVQVHKLIGVE